MSVSAQQWNEVGTKFEVRGSSGDKPGKQRDHSNEESELRAETPEREEKRIDAG